MVESGGAAVFNAGQSDEVPGIASAVGGVAVPMGVDEVEEVFDGDFREFRDVFFLQSSDGGF